MQYILMLCALLVASPCAVATEKDKQYDSFVEGALGVYSQFKTPSKAESERFYSFVQAKWTHTECSADCGELGYHIGKQYAKEQKIEIRQKTSVQPQKQ